LSLFFADNQFYHIL